MGGERDAGEDIGVGHEKERRERLGSPPACRLLHPFVSVQDTFEKLRHEGLEVSIGGLANHPVGVATESPAGDGADQSLLVA